jgi:hypothetical protein
MGRQFGHVPAVPRGQGIGLQLGGVPVKPRGHGIGLQLGGVPVKPRGHGIGLQLGGVPVKPRGQGIGLQLGGVPLWTKAPAPRLMSSRQDTVLSTVQICRSRRQEIRLLRQVRVLAEPSSALSQQHIRPESSTDMLGCTKSVRFTRHYVP